MRCTGRRGTAALTPGSCGSSPPRTPSCTAADRLVCGDPPTQARGELPMDTATLRRLLDAEGIDPCAYSLDGGLPDEAYVLEHRPGCWVVYYSERGLRTAQTGF